MSCRLVFPHRLRAEPARDWSQFTGSHYSVRNINWTARGTNVLLG